MWGEFWKAIVHWVLWQTVPHKKSSIVDYRMKLVFRTFLSQENAIFRSSLYAITCIWWTAPLQVAHVGLLTSEIAPKRSKAIGMFPKVWIITWDECIMFRCCMVWNTLWSLLIGFLCCHRRSYWKCEKYENTLAILHRSLVKQMAQWNHSFSFLFFKHTHIHTNHSFWKFVNKGNLLEIW